MRFSAVLVLVACIALTACNKRNKPENTMSIKSEEKIVHCLGRYELTLPADLKQLPGTIAEFKFIDQGENTGTIMLNVVQLDAERKYYERSVQQRLAELIPQKEANLDGFEESTTISSGLTSFRIRKVRNTHVTELHAYLGSSYFVASLKSRDNEYPAALAQLSRFVGNIRISNGRAYGNGDTGFCIGPVLVRGDYNVESVVTAYRSEKRPDIVLKITMNTFVGDEADTLLDRVEGPNSLFNMFGMPHKVLRKRELKVGEMRAQEWLGQVTNPDTQKSNFAFSLETIRTNPSLLSPKIHIDFDTGTKGLDGAERQTSMSQSEAVDLWDAIIASIQSRQVRDN